jgi:hypothetical protein
LLELPFLGEAWDDFGLIRFGFAYSAVDKPETEIVFGVGTKADEKRKFEHLLKFEELAVLPDDLVSYYLWAEDIGPDGKPRRTTGDIYFAEVKPFEEIFRAEDGSGGGGGGGAGAGGEAEELAQMQKDIITAAWNLQRKHGVQTPVAAPAPVKEPPKKSTPATKDLIHIQPRPKP